MEDQLTQTPLPSTTKTNHHANRIVIPAMSFPGYRTQAAIEGGYERNLLFKTWGGIGDQVCAEPTLRFALNNFPGCTISLASERPELFTHLEFHKVFDLREATPIWDNYLCFETIVPPDPPYLTWHFFSHGLTNAVDFSSLCALRLQLPIKDKEIRLYGVPPHMPEFKHNKNTVVVHPGRHWPSKTFPTDWWDAVLGHILFLGAVPVIIGGDTDENRGTVNVDFTGCIDLRNKLSLPESIWLLKNAKVLLTNDSAPLHLAAAGDAWIGFVATCKHPDYIMHWRHGQWAWRMENHGQGGIWDLIDYCPNKEQTVTMEHVEESILRSWLPEPKAYAEWAVEKLNASE